MGTQANLPTIPHVIGQKDFVFKMRMSESVFMNGQE